MLEFHEKIFFVFYNALGPSSPISEVTIFFAQWFPWILGILPVVYIIFLHEGVSLRRALLRIYFPSVIVFGITAVIKFFYHTPRPFALLEIPPAFIVSSDPFGLQSFPSSHTAFFFALAVSVRLIYPKFGKWFFWGALLIGVARIGAGAHWPIDIFGGIIIGLLFGFAVEKLVVVLQKS